MPEYRTFALLVLRIPRVSRDDAFEQLKRAKAEKYSPSKQGWCRCYALANAKCMVFPTQAGMMPPFHRKVKLDRCIPRVSRDDAFKGGVGKITISYSPRKQGWCRNHSWTFSSKTVFPAWAGMMLILRLTQNSISSIPRTSRDNAGNIKPFS